MTSVVSRSISPAVSMSDTSRDHRTARQTACNITVDGWSVALAQCWGVHLALITLYCILLLPLTNSLTLSASGSADLVVTLVLSRLDYGNAVMVGLPVYLVRCLQSVLNAAARLIYA